MVGSRLTHVLCLMKCGAVVPFVVLFHVSSVSFSLCVVAFRAFNPITAKVLQSVTDRWSDAILTLTESVHSWSDIQRHSGSGAALLSASNAAVTDMAKHMTSSIVDADEGERVHRPLHGSRVRRGVSLPQHGPFGGRPASPDVGADFGKRSWFLDLGLSLSILGACFACLFLLRSVVFSTRAKPYRRTRRRHSKFSAPSNQKVL